MAPSPTSKPFVKPSVSSAIPPVVTHTKEEDKSVEQLKDDIEKGSTSTLTSKQMDEDLALLESQRKVKEEKKIKFAGEKSDDDKNEILHHLWNSVSHYVPVQEKGNIIQSWRNTLKF